MEQTSGYGIFWKPHVLMAWYQDTVCKSQPEFYRKITSAFGSVNRRSYRGISRRPLIAFPSADRELNEAFSGDGTNYAARLRFYELMANDLDKEDYEGRDNDLLESEEKAREVFSVLDTKEKYEICRLRRSVYDTSKNTLGFDIGYWGGDHFSVIADCCVVPLWHPPAPEDYDNLKREISGLNSNFLFSTPAEANAFRTYYMSKSWAETETAEGQFQIIQVDQVSA